MAITMTFLEWTTVVLAANCERETLIGNDGKYE